MFLLICLASRSASKLLKLTRSGKGATFWLSLVLLLCAQLKQLPPSLSVGVTVLAPVPFWEWSSFISLFTYRQIESYSSICWSAWRFFKSQFPNWGSHFCCKGWYSGSPHPSFGQLEKQCLQTIYLNSSRPHYSRRQIYGGLVWWVYFYLVLLTAFFVTASVLVASVCICRLEALASLAVAYCPSILPTHVSWPFCLASGGWYLALGNSLLGGSGPMAWHLPSIFIIAYRQVNKFKRAKGCSGYS